MENIAFGMLGAVSGGALVVWGGHRKRWGFMCAWAGLAVFAAGLICFYLGVAHLGHPLQAAMRDCPPCY